MNIKNMKISAKGKARITEGLRWAVFVMAAATMGMRMVEVSAHESLKIKIDIQDKISYSAHI